MSTPLIGIIMGSTSDLEAMSDAVQFCEDFKIPYEVKVVSAHRTPQKMVRYAKTARQRGLKVIIAGAGGAAHLPGMVASMTELPVIGVPIKIGSMKGLDALLSIAQMPKGVPVATVSVDNAFNAGLLAARILGTSSKRIQSKLLEFQKKQIKKVEVMNRDLKKSMKKLKSEIEA